MRGDGDGDGPSTKFRHPEVKGWFLTYPRCSLSPQEVLKSIRDTHLDNAIKYHLISRELHADGEPHIHAYIVLTKKVKFSPTRFDLGHYHGNYQPARDPAACKLYVKKHGDFIESDPDDDSQLGKRASRNKVFIQEDSHSLVDSGRITLFQLPGLVKAKALYRSMQSRHDAGLRRCLWLHGLPGVGKSFWVRAREPSLYIKPQSKWWDGYSGETAVLIDDFDRHGACLSHYLKIWADRYDFSAELKGASIRPNYTRFYITSNYKPEDIFGSEDPALLGALLRRFKVIEMTSQEDPPEWA